MITDPVATLERCYERLAWAEHMLADYEARGWTATARAQRRRIAGIKATITRCTRLLGGYETTGYVESGPIEWEGEVTSCPKCGSDRPDTLFGTACSDVEHAWHVGSVTESRRVSE